MQKRKQESLEIEYGKKLKEESLQEKVNGKGYSVHFLPCETKSELASSFENRIAIAQDPSTIVFYALDDRKLKMQSLENTTSTSKEDGSFQFKIEKELQAKIIHIASERNGPIYYTLDNGDVYQSKRNLNQENAFEKPKKMELKNIKSVHCGNEFSIALDNNGSLFSWGFNIHGCLGIKGSNKSEIPLPIPSFGKVISLSTGCLHIVAITEDKKLFSWGYNSVGQLGRETKDDIGYIPEKIDLPLKVMSASCGSFHTIIMTEDSKLMGCGINSRYQLGLENNDDQNSLQTISNFDNNIHYFACGPTFTMIIKKDGSISILGSIEKFGKKGKGIENMGIWGVDLPLPITSIFTNDIFFSIKK